MKWKVFAVFFQYLKPIKFLSIYYEMLVEIVNKHDYSIGIVICNESNFFKREIKTGRRNILFIAFGYIQRYVNTFTHRKRACISLKKHSKRHLEKIIKIQVCFMKKSFIGKTNCINVY